jgi:eukaryotic-like serine/threonine-protein kinase
LKIRFLVVDKAQGLPCKWHIVLSIVDEEPTNFFRPKSTTTATNSIRAHLSAQLPPELQAQVSHRLQRFTLVGLSLGGTVLLLHFLMPSLHILGRQYSTALGMLCMMTLSFTLFLSLQYNKIPLEKVGIVASCYQVLGAIFLTIFADSRPWPSEQVLPSISPVALWLVLNPLIVPNSTRRTFVGSVLAAFAEPMVSFGMIRLGVMQMPSTTALVWRFFPTFVALIPATLASQFMYRLGIQLKNARELGSYQLLQLIGKGGMGEVWLAKHRLLARKAAIKLVIVEELKEHSKDASLRSRSAIQRFEREAQATSGLRSPHTIEVYDYGVSNDGTFYYVMEYLDGMDLQRLVEKDGPVPPERAVFLLRQVCHSLYEAHKTGLIHRDIKPANIFVSQQGMDHDFVKVLDFGLVAAMREGKKHVNQETGLTQENSILGTPAFMPPELIQGDLRPDGRADLYSLGCVAYYMLTGTVVFQAENAMKMMIAHAVEQPIPITQKANIPQALADIVHACLEKDPARRPGDAKILSNQLKALNIEELWTEEKRAKWWSQSTGSSVVADDPTYLAVRPSQETMPIAALQETLPDQSL